MKTTDDEKFDRGVYRERIMRMNLTREQLLEALVNEAELRDCAERAAGSKPWKIVGETQS